MVSSTERWVDIPGYNGDYRVSDRGRVSSFKGREPRLLKLLVDSRGYYQVALSDGGNAQRVSVHRLVACAYVSNSSGKPEVNHLNGDKLDNRVCNLSWATRSENARHAYVMGLSTVPNLRGEQHSQSKLTADEVRQIRALRGTMTCAATADVFGVSASTISQVQRRETWSHVA